MIGLSLKMLALVYLELLSSAIPISMDTETITAFVNQNVTLKCRSQEAFRWAWLRNGSAVEINNRSSRYSLISDEHASKICDLHIRNVSTNDNANWTCISKGDAASHGGKTIVSFNVIVTSAITTSPTTTQLPTTTMQLSNEPQTGTSTNLKTLSKWPNQETETTASPANETEEFPVAIVVASAASGGLLALIFGITIFVCYRCKKPKSHVIPGPIYLRSTPGNQVQFSNPSCNRHSTMPSSESEYAYCSERFRTSEPQLPRQTRCIDENKPDDENKPEYENFDGNHFYHEIVDA